MKKILIIIAILISIINIEVNAISIKEEVIANYFIKDEDSGLIYKLKYYIDEKNNYLYSSYPVENISNDVIYKREYAYEDFFGISQNKWYHIKNIMYYGYGYMGHEDLKWYIATQLLIYDEFGLNIKILDETNKDIFPNFKFEYDEIKRLVLEYEKLPSYFENNIEFNYGENFLLEDTNNASENYGYIPSYPLKVVTIEGKKYLTAPYPLQSRLYLGYRDLNYTKNTIYYNKSISLIDRSGLAIRSHKVDVLVHGFKIKVKNVNEFGECIEGVKYTLYNSLNEVILTFKTDSSGLFITDYLPKDDYYLVQEEISFEYELLIDPISISYVDYGVSEITILNNFYKTENDNEENFDREEENNNQDNSIIEEVIKPDDEIKVNDEENIIGSKENFIILDVPSTGISIRPFFIGLAITFLIISLILYAKK